MRWDQESESMSMRKMQRYSFFGVAMLALSSSLSLADSPVGERADRLVVEQTRVADQYDRFKKNITDLADFLRQTDPERAEVLEKAVEQMNRGDALERFTQVIDLLGQDALLISDVDEIRSSQEALETELQTLLALLLTENRQSQNQSEKQKIARYLKEIGRMIRMQKAVQAETERGSRPEDLVPQQAKLEKQAQLLAEKMKSGNRTAKKSNGKKATKPSQESEKESPPRGDPPSPDGNSKQAGKKSGNDAEDAETEKPSPQQAIEQARKQMRSAIENLKQAKKRQRTQKTVCCNCGIGEGEG